ncbi:4-hydroxythreonine-4-phosphate dehydrogenase PdxA [Tautonia sociabilis]|uniref:4-hydroxythreonine-4-phosphate dehydrogenase PdxA n=2 Tax=Tautonia sociabilis TaxID=2080755 RepID=A0A432MFU1_9BACT|nr:4-hydroxythreonine-4-phosphate dehydrogenase PdxA [Tautonia sociabilis]
MGDVAGIGPAVIARAWAGSRLLELARPFVVGDAGVLRREVSRSGAKQEVRPIREPEEAAPGAGIIPCLEVPGVDVLGVPEGEVDPRAGRASFAFLVRAIDLAMAGRVDAITTLPINKFSLHEAGVPFPGHTEILADRCGATRHAMMLYLPPGPEAPLGLGVVHATLHVALREVFPLLTVDSVLEKILLTDEAMRPLVEGGSPRIGVAGLNPHAGEGGLFGDEERTIIGPAIARARAEGVRVEGPISADTLFSRALEGAFEAVVVMYHDQGHVALKTIGFSRAVNVTLGLPIIRTSVAHGTAFDLVGRGEPSTSSLISAVSVAARLAIGKRARLREGRGEG